MTIGSFSVAEGSIGEPIVAAGGVDLAVPSTSIAMVGKVPVVQTGTIVTVPSGTISVSGKIPTLQTGVTITPPAGSISVSGSIPQILHSANILVPTGVISVQGAVPGVGGGALVDNPSRQDTYISMGGSIASSSIGEFGIGEGSAELTLSGRRTARLPILAESPLVQAGKLVDVPAGSISMVGRVPEIDSRGRRLRAQAILS